MRYMAPLLMFDSTDVAAIPLSAKMVLGYLDGALIPSTLPALRARFPYLTPVVVCVTAQQNGDVLDVEQGDARPTDAPGWAKRQRAQGRDPIVYCSTSAWPLVKAAFAVQNEPLPWWFEAHYDNIAVLSADPRAVAKQYANAKITGSNLDISVIGPNWPGLKPAEDNNMPYLAQGPTVGIWIVDGGKATHIPDMPDVEAYQAAGAKLIPLSDALITALSA